MIAPAAKETRQFTGHVTFSTAKMDGSHDIFSVYFPEKGVRVLKKLNCEKAFQR
jgi:hypothetical protein